MNKKIVEIILEDESSYRFLLLMSGFVISIFYNDKLISPGQAILLKKRIDKESNEFIEVYCRCVSHNNDRLVLV